MPTLRKDRAGWWARVVISGRQVASRMFPPGRKGGPEWRAAKEWEEEEKKRALEGRMILSASERLLAWGEQYLAHVQRTMTRGTLVEKQGVMSEFFAFCRKQGVASLEDVSTPLAYNFLASVVDSRTAHRANVFRKHLLAAWNWGRDFIDGFPSASPIERVRPFPSEPIGRYVPPEDDIIRVLMQVQGQDLVFLLALYFTGARRGEICRLRVEDVDLVGRKVRLVDHKAGSGKRRERWLPLHPELGRALAWWLDNRPCEREHVFMQVQSDALFGQPYVHRQHLMAKLCRKAGVRPFGFHAVRHTAASIVFVAGGLKATQDLMRHERATTTDGYVRAAGLYADQGIITEALGGSRIGQAAIERLEKAMPRESQPPEAFCTPDIVSAPVQ